MESPPAPAWLGFEAWVRLSVSLVNRAPAERDAILAREHVDPQVYAAADEHWIRLMAADVAIGKTKRAERYAAACADAQAERRRIADAAAPPALPGPPAAKPEPAPPPAPVEVEVPSFLRDTHGGMPAYVPLAEPVTMGEAPKPPAWPALPVTALPEPALFRPPPPSPGGTTDVEAILAGPALPFTARGTSAPPPPPPETPRAPPPPSGTVDVAEILSAPALPFAWPPPAQPAPAAVHAAKTTDFPAEEVSVGGFTLHQYASLCAELAVYVDRTPAVLTRYGLAGEAARRQLAALWEQRLLGDDALCRTWAELSARYREWLASQQR